MQTKPEDLGIAWVIRPPRPDSAGSDTPWSKFLWLRYPTESDPVVYQTLTESDPVEYQTLTESDLVGYQTLQNNFLTEPLREILSD
jgi:hypothetical protein